MQSTIPKVRVTIPQRRRGHRAPAMHFHNTRGSPSLRATSVNCSRKLARQYPQVHVRSCDERGEPRPHIKCFLCQR